MSSGGGRRRARERILAAAVEQIAREGIDGVRIARIAQIAAAIAAGRMAKRIAVRTRYPARAQTM